MRSPWLGVVALALGATLLFGFRLDRRSLENQDTIRNPDIAAEMLRSGDWLVPRSCDVVYTERPPVQIWAVAGLGKLFGGIPPGTARLPSMGAGVLFVLMTAGLGAVLGSWRTGLAAGAILATMSDVWVYARTARGEMMFSMLTLGAVLALVRGGRLGRAAATLCMAAAILEKGPLGVGLPLVALAAWAWTAGRGKAHPWRDAALATAVSIAGVAFTYYLPLYRHARPGEFREILETFFLKENLERVRSGWDHRPKAWWYYGESLLTNTLPWSLLLIPAVAAGWPRRWRGGPVEAFLLLWTAGGLLAFSCSAGKEARYLLPVSPSVAILSRSRSG